MVTGYVKPEDQGTVAPNLNTFVMVKNVVGALAVDLEAHDFSTPTKTFRFRFNQDTQHIPAKWAVGTFVSPGALSQMENGYFTFDNLGDLIKLAESMGYYVPDSIKEPKVTLKEMKKILLADNVQSLEKITKYMSTKTRSDLITLAQKYYDKLNSGTISYLEKTLGSSLKPIELGE